MTGVMIMIEMDMTKKATATTCTLRPSDTRKVARVTSIDPIL